MSWAASIEYYRLEIPLLVKPEHASIPLFDTTAIHARAAVDFALA